MMKDVRYVPQKGLQAGYMALSSFSSAQRSKNMIETNTVPYRT